MDRVCGPAHALTILMVRWSAGSSQRSSLSSRSLGTTLGKLSSLKRGRLGTAPRHRIPDPFRRWPYGLGLPVLFPLVCFERNFRRAKWDSHRSMLRAVLVRRSHQTPQRFAASHRAIPLRATIAGLREITDRGPPPRPKRAASQSGVAWPLRYRLLPGDTGCVPLPNGERFEQRFPYRHGPARVGLDL